MTNNNNKRIEYDTNSWHSKLYSFYYALIPPNNLCPYFWKLVIAVPTVLFFAIFALPGIIAPKFFDCEDENIFIKMRQSFWGYLGAFLFHTLIYPILWLFNRCDLGERSFHSGMVQIGLIMWCLVLVITVLFIIFMIQDKFQKNSYSLETKSPNMLTEYIKAKYNKYCPTITWIDKNEKHDRT